MINISNKTRLIIFDWFNKNIESILKTESERYICCDNILIEDFV